MCSPRVILAFALTLLSVSMVAAVDKCATEVINKVKYTRRACTFSDQQGNHWRMLPACALNLLNQISTPYSEIIYREFSNPILFSIQTGPLNGNTCTIVGN
ncbi:hypothetical protein PSTT_09001 [Puccinia striiformis]|uniref:Secreted protein n=1 Tax=Puccinia striiformis TaxID=27350 RepID=A0A2S4VAD2_9BASI|nr:hypothetical protein PSTT_09001 [Puccinia striiformis]